MRKLLILITTVMIILTLTACGEGEQNLDNNTVTLTVKPEIENQLSLPDGAAITILPNVLTGEATVTIERNPEKSQQLPELGDGMIALGDFYDFRISGAELVGPVDLELPFDQSKIPGTDGWLAAAIPAENGWQLIPVERDGGIARLRTHELGDPLIVWTFDEIKYSILKIDLSVSITDPHVDRAVVTVIGKINMTPDTSYNSFIGVTGTLNPSKDGESEQYQTTAVGDAEFSFSLNRDHLKDKEKGN